MVKNGLKIDQKIGLSSGGAHNFNLKLYPKQCSLSKIDQKNQIQPVLYFPGWWCVGISMQF